MRKFGKEAAHEGIETLTRKIGTLAMEHGDEALLAVRKVGPRTFRLVEEAGERGIQAVKLMAKYGDEAIWVVSKPNRMAIFVKLGDDAAEAMMRHGEIAEPLFHSVGKPAARALKAVNAQNARRLAILAEDGELARIGSTPELLDVVAKDGDRAMDFIWKHKGSLMVSAALVAFLANAEPFLSGTADMTKTLVENTVKPLAEVPGQVAAEAAKSANWTVVFVVGIVSASVAIGLVVAKRIWPAHRSNKVAQEVQPAGQPLARRDQGRTTISPDAKWA